METFKIPRLGSIAARTTSRIKGKRSRMSVLHRQHADFIEHCPYCRHVHNLSSYCSRASDKAAKMVKRKSRRISSSSSSSSSSSEEGELSDASLDGSGEAPSDSEEEGKKSGPPEDPLEDFFSTQKRVDAKEPTLTLLPSTVKYYFSTVLKNGELTKEGREELRDKYYLEPGQFEKFRPPRLDDTKLFGLGDKEFKDSRAGRLISLHSR